MQCYDKFSWMTFVKVKVQKGKPIGVVSLTFLRRKICLFVCGPQYSDETLAVFKSYKLDDMQASKRKLEDLRASGGDHVYFAKFLTSEKVKKKNLLDFRKIQNVDVLDKRLHERAHLSIYS